MNHRLHVRALSCSLAGAMLLSAGCGGGGTNPGSSGQVGGGSGSSTGAGGTSGAGTMSGVGTAGMTSGSVAQSGTSPPTTGSSGTAVTSGTSGSSSGTGTTGTSSGTATTGATSGTSSGTGSSGMPTGGADTTGPNSILQRGPDLMRRETFIQPTLTKAAAAALTMDTAFTTGAKFNGGMAASVLYVENGPPMAGCPATAKGCVAMTRTAGAGIFIATTGGGTVYALDETTGATVWTGSAPGGGDGIRGTGVIDGATRTLFVTNGGGGQHMVHGLSIDDGTERTGWPVKLSNTTLTVNGTAFNSVDQNEHGAMMYQNGIVYVPFGGHYGDGGTYRGWVVAIQESNPTNVGGWVSAGGSEGIWAHGGGMASDGTNIYAVTGNGHAGDHTSPMTDAEEVVKFSGMGTFARNAQNVYYPAAWKSMDGSDKDFGADSPSYVPLPAGSTPSALLVAPAKPGAVYFLDANNLSSGKYPNAGGELQMLTVGNTGAESVYTAPSIYYSGTSLYAAIDVEVGAVCPGGTMPNQTILTMQITPGGTPFAKTVWCASATGNGGKQYNQPPISTTTDAAGSNALVWYTNGGALTAVDGATGATVLPGNGMCTGMEKMMWPIVVKGRIIVAADGHLCAWK